MCLNLLCAAVPTDIIASLETLGMRADRYEDPLDPQELLQLAEPMFVDAILIDADRSPQAAASARLLREQQIAMPFIGLTAHERGAAFSAMRIEVLNAGGDDLLPKSVPPLELAATLNAANARRALRIAGDCRRITRGGTTIEASLLSKSITINGRATRLPQGEFSILHALLERQGQVVSASLLLERRREYGMLPDSNILQVEICRLRKRLDSGGGEGMLIIETIRGSGYLIPEP